jgi:hypothetical protein
VRFANLASIYNSTMVGKDDTEKQAEASQEEDEEVEDDGWISQQSDDHPVGRQKALDVGLQLQLDDPYLQDLLADEPRITAFRAAPAAVLSEALSDLVGDEDMDLECSWDL